MRKLVQRMYGGVLEAALEGERRCFAGKRWGGHTVLIVVDAALDSIGLNYFKIVVPRVRRFYEDYVKTNQIASLKALAGLTPQDRRLRQIMNNQRTWSTATAISRELLRIKIEKNLKSDLEALRRWAERAHYETWMDDPIGRINGVGLITFQYLRMQAGIDTTMPDKVIKRVAERDFGIKAEDNIQFIKQMETLSKNTGYSQTTLCWAIWLRESGVRTSSWERVSQ